jgi:hypothetical protein
MEEVKTKVCPKCGEEKPLTDEFWYQSKYIRNKRRYVYWRRYCKKCASKIAAQSRKKHPQKWIDYKKQYYQDHHDKVLFARKKRRTNNPDKYKAMEKQRDKKNRIFLTDRYIRQCLRNAGIMFSDITPEMIEIKRQQLILHRLLKQFTKEGLYEFSSAEVNGNQRDAGEVQEERGYSGGGTGVCLTC